MAFRYVPNEYYNTVSVIDTATNLVVGTIPVGGTYLDTVVARGDGAFVYAVNENGSTAEARRSTCYFCARSKRAFDQAC